MEKKLPVLSLEYIWLSKGTSDSNENESLSGEQRDFVSQTAIKSVQGRQCEVVRHG